MTVNPEHQMAPSKDGWYVVAWGEKDEWDFGIFVQVIDGEFYDEDGEALESIFDPVLQCRIAPDAADAYIPQ